MCFSIQSGVRVVGWGTIDRRHVIVCRSIGPVGVEQAIEAAK